MALVSADAPRLFGLFSTTGEAARHLNSAKPMFWAHCLNAKSSEERST
jgi:hypothetical protein